MVSLMKKLIGTVGINSMKYLCPKSSIFTPIQMKYSSYEPYPKFEDTSEPFHPPFPRRYGLEYKYWTGGVLPRPKGEFEETRLKIHNKKSFEKDVWESRRALYGQNDYIDILGDGSLHPHMMIGGPKWLRAYKGNELQRLIRRMKFEGKMLQDVYPRKYMDIRKRIYFLWKKMNQRTRIFFVANRKRTHNSRFLRIKDSEMSNTHGHW